MEVETVYRFKKYDIGSDDYVVSTRMATIQRIRKLGAEPLLATETLIDAKHVDQESWTKKNFTPEPVERPPASFQSQVR